MKSRNSRSMFGVLPILGIAAAVGLVNTLSPASADEGRRSDRSADAQADRLIAEMTLDEKIQLVHGHGLCGIPIGAPSQGRMGAGFIPGIPRLGIPDINHNDGGAGVGDCGGRPNAQATALPAALAVAASWDEQLAYDYGALIGKETRQQGFNSLLGGSIGLAREPRSGRTFEYHGEDPLLSGKLIVAKIHGIQDQDVIANFKHYALNQQESGRQTTSSNVDERTMRELYLLHFEIGVKEANPGSVMCSYNKVNGVFACENHHLLNQILKDDWGFKGWVLSDWGATHSTVLAANSGLDEEEFRGEFFGPLLTQAVLDDQVPMTRLDEMVHRKLRTLIRFGFLDNPPPEVQPIDIEAGNRVAQHVAEQSSVLLKNDGDTLPLDKGSIRSIAIIGSHADVAVLSGGGSGAIVPIGGPAIPPSCNLVGPGPTHWCEVWHPSSPLNAIRAKAPGANVQFNDGLDPAAAAALATASDVAIVFAHQWTTEGADEKDLSLRDDPETPDPTIQIVDPVRKINQDELISAVAAVNSRTIVVLENGSPVLMPWIDDVEAVLETWYSGIKGGEAIANLLFGDVNPSGKLPLTFPKSEADLPSPNPPQDADVTYTEGVFMGYRWFDGNDIEPLFPFGHGLSYTSFSYSRLRVSPDNTNGKKDIRVSFRVTNTGSRAGAEVAQVYLGLPASTGEPPKRLVGWEKVYLEPGETKRVRVRLDPDSASHPLSFWNVDKGPIDSFGDWDIATGEYQVYVGSSSRDIRLLDTLRVHER